MCSRAAAAIPPVLVYGIGHQNTAEKTVGIFSSLFCVYGCPRQIAAGFGRMMNLAGGTLGE
jgi:hypothetical protein